MWGKRGAVWGGLWGLFFGGLFLSIPIVGHVIFLGYIATAALAAAEGAVGLCCINVWWTRFALVTGAAMQAARTVC